MSSKELKIRFESQLSRMNCQTFSCGFSSGHFAGNGTTVMLIGTVRRPEGVVTFTHFTCQPRCALKDRNQENQSVKGLEVRANPTGNGLFLASVTMPSCVLDNRLPKALANRDVTLDQAATRAPTALLTVGQTRPKGGQRAVDRFVDGMPIRRSTRLQPCFSLIP
jgi:hypothetical protein